MTRQGKTRPWRCLLDEKVYPLFSQRKKEEMEMERRATVAIEHNIYYEGACSRQTWWFGLVLTG